MTPSLHPPPPPTSSQQQQQQHDVSSSDNATTPTTAATTSSQQQQQQQENASSSQESENHAPSAAVSQQQQQNEQSADTVNPQQQQQQVSSSSLPHEDSSQSSIQKKSRKIHLSKKQIQKVMHLSQSDGAKELGVSVSTLKRRMNEIGLRWPRMSRSNKSSTKSKNKNNPTTTEAAENCQDSNTPSQNHAPSSNGGKSREGIQQSNHQHRFAPYPNANNGQQPMHATPSNNIEPPISLPPPTLNPPPGVPFHPPSSFHSATIPLNVVQLPKSEYFSMLEELQYLRGQVYQLQVHLENLHKQHQQGAGSNFHPPLSHDMSSSNHLQHPQQYHPHNSGEYNSSHYDGPSSHEPSPHASNNNGNGAESVGSNGMHHSPMPQPHHGGGDGNFHSSMNSSSASGHFQQQQQQQPPQHEYGGGMPVRQLPAPSRHPSQQQQMNGRIPVPQFAPGAGNGGGLLISNNDTQ